MMDSLNKMAREGGFNRAGPTYHVQAHYAPTVHALDSDGVDEVLEKHADKLQKQFEGAMRRMNK
jgi:hypothetical protein